MNPAFFSRTRNRTVCALLGRWRRRSREARADISRELFTRVAVVGQSPDWHYQSSANDDKYGRLDADARYTSCTDTLAPKANCTISVFFSPTKTEPSTAVLS